MTEARIIYEIYECGEISARDIASKLHVDKSYLSRILKRLESQLLIERKLSTNSSRLVLISLTEKGKKLTESLIADSNCQVEKHIIELSDSDLDNLSYHLNEITKILGRSKK